jgi:hypothetical protein
MSGIKNRIKNELQDGGVKMGGSLGKTPGYARYSGYDTEEQEDEYLSLLGPVWCDGDPMPEPKIRDEVVDTKRAKGR